MGKTTPLLLSFIFYYYNGYNYYYYCYIKENGKIATDVQNVKVTIYCSRTMQMVEQCKCQNRTEQCKWTEQYKWTDDSLVIDR